MNSWIRIVVTLLSSESFLVRYEIITMCIRTKIKVMFVILDTKEKAEIYCKNARQILQTDYDKKKKQAAARKHFNTVEIDDDHPEFDENKQAIRDEIHAKMQQLNDQFFDLTEDEIDQIQEVIDFEYDDEISQENVRNDSEANFVQTTVNYTNDSFVANEVSDHTNNANNNVADRSAVTVSAMQIVTLNHHAILNEENDGNNSDQDLRSEASFEWIPNDADQLHKPLTSKIEVEQLEETFENNGEFVQDLYEMNDVDSCQNTPNVMNQSNSDESSVHEPQQINEISEQSCENNIVADRNAAGVINEIVNLVNVKQEKRNANSGNIPMFSPPSTSSNIFQTFGQIPSHFARLDPGLYNTLSGQQEPNQSNEGRSEVSSIQEFLNLVPTLFPSHYTNVR